MFGMSRGCGWKTRARYCHHMPARCHLPAFHVKPCTLSPRVGVRAWRCFFEYVCGATRLLQIHELSLIAFLFDQVLRKCVSDFANATCAPGPLLKLPSVAGF